MADMWKIKPSIAIPEVMVTNTFNPPIGYTAVENLGIVKGVSVRTRNLCGNIVVALNALIGGQNYLLVQLVHDVRQEAYNRMIEEAAQKGANSVIGVRYESVEVGTMCYGTALRVEKA